MWDFQCRRDHREMTNQSFAVWQELAGNFKKYVFKKRKEKQNKVGTFYP